MQCNTFADAFRTLGNCELGECSAGTTVYGIEPETGLINLHLDTWDAVSNQEYFSGEAFMDVLAQIFNLQRTPDIPTPQYTLLQ
jgi:hypothetical protein